MSLLLFFRPSRSSGITIIRRPAIGYPGPGAFSMEYATNPPSFEEKKRARKRRRNRRREEELLLYLLMEDEE